MTTAPISDVLMKATNCLYLVLGRDLGLERYNEAMSILNRNSPLVRGVQLWQIFDTQAATNIIDSIEHARLEGFATATIVHTINSYETGVDWNIAAVNGGDFFELAGVVKAPPAKGLVAEPLQDRVVYKSLFDNTPNAVVRFDREGRVMEVNKAFATSIGFSQEEMQEQDFEGIIGANDREKLAELFDRAIGGDNEAYDTMVVGKNGQKIHESILHVPIVDAQQNTVGVFGIFKNIDSYVNSRIALQRQEKRLRFVLSKLKKIMDSSIDVICSINENGKFTRLSAASVNILGYYPKELKGTHFLDLVHEEDKQKTREQYDRIKAGNDTTNFENRYIRKDGTIANLVWSSRWDEADRRFYSIGRDAAEKKAGEAALKASEEKYKILFHHHPLPSWIFDTETFRFLEVNDTAVTQYGYSREEFMTMQIHDLMTGTEAARFDALFKDNNYQGASNDLWLHRKKNGETFYVDITSNYINFLGREACIVLAINRNKEVLAEKELLKSNERYRFLSEATFDAIYDWNVKSGEITWNEGVKKMFNVKPGDRHEHDDWWQQNTHAEDLPRVEESLQHHIVNKSPYWEDEYRFRVENDRYKYIFDRGYIFYDDNSEFVRMIGAMQDLTERKAHEDTLQRLNNSLEKRARELAESNEELERFAYVASHDLQEPLRMVTSFLQLLEKRYKDKLDQKAHEYISYAVDGAERMKRLILDLLEYSRVNSSVLALEDVDVNQVIAELKMTYKNLLAETRGNMVSENMPVVKGNKTQLLQLFQNLISNAFKYRSEEPPLINIQCEEEANAFKFSITDNGLGISPKFFNKIFIIFQRLHNREQYSGTGIGLAICKKIVDKHGGKIWVNSEPGQGSTFYFTISKHQQIL